MEALHERGQRQVFPGAGAGPRPHRPAEGQLRGSRRPPVQPGEDPGDPVAKVVTRAGNEPSRSLKFLNQGEGPY